jgi:hypothetical protein
MTAQQPRQIVCVTTEHPHRHILSVGVGGWSSAPTVRLTVGQVRAALSAGEVFYTYSPSTQKTALVDPDTCKATGCTVKTIRSAPDAVWDNNLDNLAVCP